MTAETVNFIFYCFLKAIENQKGHNHDRQAYTNTGYRYFMDGRGEAVLLLARYSFRYKIAKVQELSIFDSATQIN